MRLISCSLTKSLSSDDYGTARFGTQRHDLAAVSAVRCA